MRKLTSKILLLLAVFVLWQCTRPKNEYSSFHTFGTSEWLYGDTIVFTPEFGSYDEPIDSAIATTVRGNIDVAVCHTNSYPYSNLWLEISRQLNDSVVAKDTINMQLADVYGNWLGKGAGMNITHTATALRDISLTSGRPLKIRHIMRIDTLPDIDRIGIIFHPSQQ